MSASHLHTLQSNFVTDVFASPSLASLLTDSVVAGQLSAAKRVAIYRHNVFSNLVNALGDLYPVTERIVGEEFFTTAARQYVSVSPSTSGDLNDFGASFADFIARYEHAAELPYLADVARVEWAWHRAFHAEDAPSFDIGRFAAITPDALGDTVLALAPGTALFASSYPLLRIWEVNQPDYAGEFDLDWSMGECFLLLWRVGLEVALQECPPGDYAMLKALLAGEALSVALASTLAVDSAFDVQSFLVRSVQSRVITSFQTPT